ncbi:FAD-binding protein [Serinicoccus kebangsaanensis]|uniref:FAD-binding protein n=1 Tax=Serinicoccus kebangsaanensis TaxID=2602069 RepID=UPI00124D68BB|nr:FAD-binding protein [Serinicoccus kebangsaanensis]
MTAAGSTWAKNYAYSARELVEPASLDELAEVMASADAVRLLGSRHSFNRIADTTGTMVGLGRLPVDVSVDGDRRLARVEGGAAYGVVAQRLAALGWGLHAMASLPHITVAGAVATDTHGSGDGIPSLAEGVAAVELVTTEGEQVRLERGEDDFGGAVVSLGTLGAVTALELDVEPSYDVAQTVYEGLTWDAVAADLDAVTGLGTSVSVFTWWKDADRVDQVWVKQRTDTEGGDPAALGLVAADGQRHMLPGGPGERCTRQGGVPGPWLDRLPHFRMDFTPSNGAEVQSEWLLPRERAGEAIDALRGLAARMEPVLQVCEMRAVAAGRQWLGLTQGVDCVAFHFTWGPDQGAVERLIPHIEEGLTPLGARPHWGKLFGEDALAGRVDEAYPHRHRLGSLRRRLDPRGALRNDFLDRLGI